MTPRDFFRLIRRKISKFYEYYQQDGLWKTCILTCDHLGLFRYRTLIFFALEFDKEQPPTPSETLELVQLTEKDIEPVEDYWDGWFQKKETLRRLEQGHSLFVVKAQEKWAFYQWLEFERMDIPYLDLTCRLTPETVCMAYIYTEPDFRGQGLATRAKPAILEYIRQKAYRRVVLMITPQNSPSQKVNTRAGFRAYQRVTYIRVCFVKYYHIQSCGDSRSAHVLTVKRTHPALWRTFL